MSPTNPNAVSRPRIHKPLVVMNPAGGTTFGVECSFGDFRCDRSFLTMDAAQNSVCITEHVAAHALTVGAAS